MLGRRSGRRREMGRRDAALPVMVWTEAPGCETLGFHKNSLFKTKSFLMYSTQISQSGRFSPAFSNREASEGHPKSVSHEGAVVLLRPGRAFLIGAEEWKAALCLPSLFAPHSVHPTWLLSLGDNCSVSDEDASKSPTRNFPKRTQHQVSCGPNSEGREGTVSVHGLPHL